MTDLTVILSEILVYLIIIGIGSVASLCGMLYRCVHKQGKRGLRQSKTILILVKSIEEQIKRNHKDYTGSLFEEADILLKDEKGEL